MPTIAAAIITFNEEKNIERCILGLIDCVDEIVVLDSFSTDRTQEICSRYPIRFIQKKWEGYAQTKNNLNEYESKLLDQSVKDLKMNFVFEQNNSEEDKKTKKEDKKTKK